MQTLQGRVTGIWGTAVIRGADGKMRALKLGELVHKGDVILTSQNGLVQLSPEDSVTARDLLAKQPQPEIDRVIGALNDPNGQDATAAGLSGGDDGDLAPMLRVGRIAEGVTPASLALPVFEGARHLETVAGGQVTPQQQTSVPPNEITADSETIDAIERGPAVNLGLTPPAGLSASAVITVTAVPAIGALQKADGTVVGAGTTLSAAELAGLKYVPPTEYNGHDPVGAITYTVTDQGGSATGTVGILLTPVNDAPIAQADTGSGAEDTPLTGNVLANDTDPDSPSLTVTQYTIAGVNHPAGSTTTLVGIGDIVVNADGNYVFTPAPDYNGPVPTIGYTVTDGQLTSTSTLTLTVTAVNDAPDAANDLASTPVNTPVTVAVLANDHDRDGDALTVTNATLADPSQGSVVVNSDGTVTYTPASNLSGPVTISYTVSDGHGGTDAATITVNVGNNAPPDGADKTVTIDEDTSKTFSAADFGYTDADAGQTLANVRIDTLPSGGTLTLGGHPVTAGEVIAAGDLGTLVYTPAPNANGAPYASFTFSVQDSAGAFDTAPNTISINVTPQPDPAVITGNNTGATVEDTTLVAAGKLDVVDPDAGEAAFQPQTNVAGAHGTFSIDAAGNWIYTLNNADPAVQALGAGQTLPSETFTVKSIDGTTAQVTVSITGTDDAPVISTGTGLVTENIAPTATGTLTATDVDNPALAFVPATISGAYGSLVLQSNGQWTYTLDARAEPLAQGQVVSEPVTVHLNDGSTTTVTITVTGTDDAPVISTGTGAVTENTAPTTTGTLTATDVDNPALAFVPATINGNYGSLLLQSNGHWTYTLDARAEPLAQGQVVTEPITVHLNDGSTTTVTITVTGTDDAPVISTGTGAVTENTAPTTTGALTATDADNPALAFVPATISGNYGSLVLQSNGQWTYTLDARAEPLAQGQVVTEPITVHLNDGSTTTVTITVTGTDDAPVISTGVGAVTENTAPTTTGTLTATDVDNPALAFVPGTINGNYGSLVLQSNGQWTYTLDARAEPLAQGQVVTEPITVHLNDGSTTTVTITVTGTNDAAVITGPASGSVTEDATLLASGKLTATDVDSPASFAPQSLTLTYGNFSIDAAGNWSYTLRNGDANVQALTSAQHPTETVSVATADGTTQLITITVNGANEVPTATITPATGAEDAPGIPISLTGADVDGSIASFTLTALPANGTLYYAGNPVVVGQVIPAGANAASLSFVPNADWNGSTSLSFSATDNEGAVSTPVTQPITVTAVNDAPVAANDSFTTNEDTSVVIDVLANDKDVDGDPITITQINGAPIATGGSVAVAGGSVTLNANGTLTFKPSADYNGNPTFTYTIADGHGGSATATVSGTVNPVNDPPALDLDANNSHNLVTTQPIAGLYNTGVDNAGIALPDGSTDPHYVLIAAPAGSGVTNVTRTPSVYTVPNDANSAWLGSNGNEPAGNYQYQTSFTLQAGADPRTVSIGMDIAGDDTVRDILVNGVSTGLHGELSYAALTHFVIDGANGAFQSGVNTITFVINNDQGNNTGLRVDNMSGTVAVVGSDPVGHQSDYATSFVEGGAPVAIADNDTLITDVDSTTMQGAVITLTNAQAGDALVAGTMPAGITATASAGGTVITLAGAGSLAAYQAAIQAIQFNNTSNAPSTVDRTITVTVSDGGLSSNTATTTVHVTPVDSAPVAQNDVGNGSEDTFLGGNVLANDGDVEGSPLTVTFFTVAGDITIYRAGVNDAHIAGIGALYIDADGKYGFTPEPDYNGAVPVVTYTVSDGTKISTGTLTLSVAPVADIVADSVTTPEDTDLVFNPISGSQGASADNFEGTPVLTAVGTPAHGTVSVDPATGDITYKPAANYHGPDSFSYTVTSGGVTETATINVDVTSVNDAPVAANDIASTPINTAVVNIPVLANDKDVDGDTLTVTSAALANPALGTVTVNPNGTLDYTPAANVTGPVAINYTISDGHGGTSSAVLTVNVGANTPPAGTDNAFTIDEDTGKTFALADFGFSDADVGQTLAGVRIDALPAAGTLTLNGTPVAAGAVIAAADLPNLVYTPAANASGAPYASFTFSVQDSAGAFDTTSNTVTINVTPVPDAAVIGGVLNGATVEDTTPSATGLLTVVDPDAGEAAFQPQTNVAGAHGTFSIDAAGHWTYALDNADPAVQALGAGQTLPSEVFAVRSIDGTIAQVTVSITGTDDAPVISTGAGAVTENAAPSATGTLTATDVDNPALAFVPTTISGSYGALVLQSNGQWTYTLDARAEPLAQGQVVTEPITVHLNDGSTTTVTITVTGTNDAAVITGPATGSVTEDATLLASGQLSATDIDGPASFTPQSLTLTYGNFSIDAAGLWSYTLRNADANVQALTSAQHPTETVTVATADGTTQQITITVNGANEAPTAIVTPASGAEDAVGIAVTLAGSDVDGAIASFTVTALPANGTLMYAGNPVVVGQVIPAGANAASLSFVPNADWNGSTSLSFSATDNEGAVSATVTQPITVIAVNDAPVAVADFGDVAEDGTLTTNALTGVIQGAPGADHDVDNATTALLVSGVVAGTGAVTQGTGIGTSIAGAYGHLTLNADGSYKYDADNANALAAGASGTDVFTYTVMDPSGAVSNTATLTITVNGTNDAPAAANDVFTTREDTPITFDVRSNDTDADSATLTVTQINGTAIATGGSVAIAGGSVKLNLDGTLTFNPATNYNGNPSFSYTVSDGALTSTATVNGTVTPVNDPPLGTSEAVQTPEDVAVGGNVLANDTDADGDTLSVTSYTVLGQAHAAGTSVFLTESGTMVNSDTGLPEPYTIDYGTLVINANGSYTFTPAPNYAGSVPPIVYTLTDGAATVTATLSVFVTAVNDAPVATPGAVSGNEDTTIAVALAGTDVDGGIASITITALPANGTLYYANGTTPVVAGTALTPAEAATLKFTPVANWNGTTGFTFTVTDNQGATSTAATETITVNPVNDAPAATPNTVTGNEDTTIAVALAGTDVDGTIASVTVTALPANGTLYYANGITPVVAGASLTPAEAATLKFTPAANYNGTTSFTFTVTDNLGVVSTPATETITVNPVNDAPVAIPNAVSGNEDTTIGVALAGTDIDGTIASVTVTVLPANGTLYYADGVTAVLANAALTPAEAATLKFTPAANYNGATSLTFTVTDNQGLTSTQATETITVSPVNDAPTALATTVIGTEDTPIVFNWGQFQVADVDTPAASLSVRVTSLPVEGKLEFFNGSTWTGVTAGQLISKAAIDAGSLRFMPDANESGDLSFPTTGLGNQKQHYANFTFQAYDGSLNSIANPTITLDVTPIADTPSITVASNSVASTVFSNGWESQSGLLYQGTFEGWTLVTTPDPTPTGIDPNGFEVWTKTEQVGMASGAIHNGFNVAPGGGNNVLELNDTNGSGLIQTLGITRTVNTVAGQVYDFSFDYAGRFGYNSTYTQLKVTINGVAVDFSDTSTETTLDWHNLHFAFNGTGGPVVIEIRTDNVATDVGGRGAFIDNMLLTTQQGIVAGNAVAGTKTDIGLGQYITNPQLADADGSEGLTVQLSAMPSGAQILVGGSPVAAVGGVVTLTPAQLAGATLRLDSGVTGDVTLNVNAVATETSNNSTAMSPTQTLHLEVLKAVSNDLGTVDQAPVAVNDGPYTTAEDTKFTVSTTTLMANDSDPDDVKATLAITSVGNPTNGTVALVGGNVEFMPDKDFVGTATFQYTLQDPSGSFCVATATVNVTPVNDAPENKISPYTTSEETPLKLAGLEIKDVDAASGTMTVTLGVGSGSLTAASGGGVTVSGSGTTSLTLSGTLANLNAWLASASSQPTYTPVANFAGNVNLTMTTNDNGNTGTGGARSDTDVVVITVSPVNDAPSGANKTITINEDSPYTVATADFGFTDPNDSPANALAAVIVNMPSAGTLKLNGVALTATTTVTAADIAAGLLTFTPAQDANGTAYGNFTFQVRDNGGTANGGVDTDPTPNTITFNVTAVNDAPVNKVDPYTTNEDTPIKLSGLSMSDVDAGSASMTVTLAVGSGTLTAATSGGVTVSGSGTGTLTLTGTQASINTWLAASASQPTYNPVANATGSVNLTMTTSDNGNTGTGGAKTDVDIVTITINPVNDAPNGANKTITINEDSPYTVATADFGFTDTGDSPANALAAVIVNMPSAGTLKLNGTALSATTTVTAADIAAGLLTYEPALNANGTAYGNFTFQVQDNGGTANGGVDIDPTPNTITFNVTAVNDAPVNRIDPYTTNEDTPIKLSGLSISDVDAGSSSMTVTLAVGSGTLTAASSGGVTISGSGTGTLTLTGTQANINTWLAASASQPTYNPVANASGAVNLTMTTNDNGNTGTGGAKTDADTVAITINAVNDPPIAVNDSNAVSTASATLVQPTTKIYYNDAANRQLVEIDVATGTHTVVMNNLPVFYDIAQAPDGRWYGIAPNGGTGFYTFDPANGEVTQINPSTAAYNSLGFGQDGTAYATYGGVITSVNLQTGVLTSLVGGPGSSTSLGDLVIIGTNAYLSTTTSTIAKIDLTGVNPVTTLATGINALGMAMLDSTHLVAFDTAGGTANSSAKIIDITTGAITDAPQFYSTGANAYGGAENRHVDYTISGNVLTNDSDVEGDPLTVTAFSQGATSAAPGATITGAYGTLILNANGTYNYILDTSNAAYKALASGVTKTDVFSYSISDGKGGTASANLTINVVGSNDAPSARNDNVALYDRAGASSGNVLTNDSDVDGNALTVTGYTINGTTYTTGSSNTISGVGTITMGTNGAYTFTPLASYHGDLTVIYRISDGAGGTDVGNLVFTGMNDAPVNTTTATYTTNEDTSLKLSGLSINDPDAGTGNMMVTLAVTSGAIAAAAGGGVTVSGSGSGSVTLTGTLANLNAYLAAAGSQPTYTPVADASGAVTLTMTTNDNGNTGAGGAQTTQTLSTINVVAVADLPTLAAPVRTLPAFSEDWQDGNANVGSMTWTGTPNVESTFAQSLYTNVQNPHTALTPANNIVAEVEGNANSGTSSISSTMTFASVQPVEISFDTIVRTIGLTSATDAGEQRFNVLWNGTLLGTYTPGAAWASGDFEVMSLAGNNTLSLVALDTSALHSSGGVIDNIAVKAIAETTIGGTAKLAQVTLPTFGDSIDNSETHTLTLNAIPVGATITDGTHSFTASAGNTTITLYNEDNPSASTGGSNWTLSSLSINSPGTVGEVAMRLDATATEASNGSTSTASQTLVAAFAPTTMLANNADTNGNDTLTAGSTSTYIVGGDGNDTLTGGAGNDWIRGDAGNDVIAGGAGNDYIAGGKGNDTLTGGTGSDVFKWSLADNGTTAAKATDTITDFDNSATGDKLDLRDLLVGEHSGGTSNLTNYLHFTVSGGTTTISISSSGAFNGSNYGTATDQAIVLTGVNLVGSFANDAAVIADLLARQKVVVDA